MDKKRWADFSALSKLGITVLCILQVSLLIFALWDIAHRPPEKIRGNKQMWTALAFINWIGPIVYFVYGRKGTKNLCNSVFDPDTIMLVARANQKQTKFELF